MFGWIGWMAAWMTPAGAAPVPPELVERAAGTWSGVIDAGGAQLRLVVHLEAAEGALVGTMDSLDQGATGIPLAAVTATAAGLSFTLPSASGAFNGKWTADGALSGTWTQGPAALPLKLSRGPAPAAKTRPQDPVPPLPYDTRELAVDSAPGVRLSGTLTLPPTTGRHPAMVLLTGSGAQDRDEALAGHRPFLVLADALTRAGWVVYRFDDRGYGRSTGTFNTATTQDFAVDAAAAVRAVAAQPEVDPARVGVLGHSEGGMAAVIAAGQAPVAFVVLLAGPGLSGKVVLESQVEALSRASGVPDAVAKQNRAIQRQILDVLAAGGSEADLRAVMRKVGIPEDQIAAQAPSMVTPWYRAFLAFDPAPGLRALKVPVLALLAERDMQVVATENGAALRAALAGNNSATVTVLPGLNHLFQPAKTGLPAEYGAIETTIDPSALAAIVAWGRSR